jgi:hypothetical protein
MATFGLVATGRSDLQRVGERISRPLGPEISRIEMPSPSDIGGHQTGQPFLMPGSHRLSESSRATAVSNRGTQSTIPAFDRADLSMRGHDTGPVRLPAHGEGRTIPNIGVEGSHPVTRSSPRWTKLSPPFPEPPRSRTAAGYCWRGLGVRYRNDTANFSPNADLSPRLGAWPIYSTSFFADHSAR